MKGKDTTEDKTREKGVGGEKEGGDDDQRGR